MNYDPSKKYFGPQGNWLSKIIPTYPPGLKCLEDDWNYCAWKHDKAYSGKPKNGLFLRIFFYLTKSEHGIDYQERRESDLAFYNGLIASVDKAFIKEEIDLMQRRIAEAYAVVVYESIRTGGVLFYKKEK